MTSAKMQQKTVNATLNRFFCHRLRLLNCESATCGCGASRFCPADDDGAHELIIAPAQIVHGIDEVIGSRYVCVKTIGIASDLCLRRDIPSERHDRYTRVIKVLPASEPDLSATVECKAVFRRQRLRREDTASDADREKDDGEH